MSLGSTIDPTQLVHSFKAFDQRVSMPCYRCLLQGENFPGESQSFDELMGFYTNRFVQASDPDAAVRMVMEQIVQDSRIIHLQDVINSGPNNPAIYIERVWEIDQLPSITLQGFIWYPMSSEQ
jgi:hypothetical protein